MVVELSAVDGPPVLLVASGDGELFNYRWLVRTLGSRVHLVGVREPGHYGTEPRPRDFEQLSRACLEALRDARIDRPVAVIGHSSGGVLAHRLACDLARTGDPPLVAKHPEIPEEHAIRGFAGVRAYTSDQTASAMLLHQLGFKPGWEVRGDERGAFYVYDDPPAERGLSGAGTVHHVAWAAQPEEHEAWRERVLSAGGQPTPVIDRFYFRSIYFREPSGVLFEIATLGGPGFAADEPLVVVFDAEQAGHGVVERRGELEEGGERAVVQVPAVSAPPGGDVAVLVELTVGLGVAQGTGMFVGDARAAGGGSKCTLREPAAAG